MKQAVLALCDITLIGVAAFAVLAILAAQPLSYAWLNSLGVFSYASIREPMPMAGALLGAFTVLVLTHFALAGQAPSAAGRSPAGRKKKKTSTDLADIAPDAPDAFERVAAALVSPDRFMHDAVELVSDILFGADLLQASDIHLEPKAQRIHLAYRIDGVIRDVGDLPASVEGRLTNRFCVISKLDFTRLNVPQDGRVQEEVRGKAMNLRVSIFPVLHGAKIVVRLLDVGARTLPLLDELGIQANVLAEFRRMTQAPQGLLLFTGPTGSGKTTLMYATLREAGVGRAGRRNVATLEDPIERILPELNQTQMDAGRGLTFATGLRTILRQDPDVIMVGEIRDKDTAEIALRAGQTGHLIMSTVHTNSSAGAFGRLIDMGLEPFLLVSAISGVVATRLVRRLCPHCRYPKPPPDALITQLGENLPPGLQFYESKGCAACNNSGIAGRMLIFELLTMNDAVMNAVLNKLPASEIQRVAAGSGMTTLLQDGLGKVGRGDTSLMELLRVVQ